MTEKKPQTAPAPPAEEIEAQAARLIEKWGQGGSPANGQGGSGPTEPKRTEISGPILQTLEKGRTHAVTVEVKKPSRRRIRPDRPLA